METHLKVEFFQLGDQLSDGSDRVVGHVDTISQSQTLDFRRE